MAKEAGEEAAPAASDLGTEASDSDGAAATPASGGKRLARGGDSEGEDASSGSEGERPTKKTNKAARQEEAAKQRKVATKQSDLTPSAAGQAPTGSLRRARARPAGHDREWQEARSTLPRAMCACVACQRGGQAFVCAAIVTAYLLH